MKEYCHQKGSFCANIFSVLNFSLIKLHGNFHFDIFIICIENPAKKYGKFKKKKSLDFRIEYLLFDRTNIDCVLFCFAIDQKCKELKITVHYLIK